MTKILKFSLDGRFAKLLSHKYEKTIRPAFSFSPPGARFSPAFREHTWDGTICMMKNNIVPVGLLRSSAVQQALLDDNFKIKITKWRNRPSYKDKTGFVEKVAKYSYQNDCVKAMLKAIPFGGGLVLSATGSGKTKIAAQFASWVDSPILFVVDEVALLYQSAQEIEEWLKEKVGIVGNSKYEPAPHITIATIQTLHRHSKKPAFRRWLRSIKIVLIDEIHVQMARRNFSVIDAINPAAVFGLTATLQLKKKPVRMKANAICGPVIYEFPITEGIAKKVLTSAVAVQVQLTGITADKPNLKFASMQQRMSAVSKVYTDTVVNNNAANSFVVRLVNRALDKGYVCVVLPERIAHLKDLEERFIKSNRKPKVCYGAVKVSDRRKFIKKMDASKATLIIANQVFKKGINVKRVDVIVDCAQRSNKNDTGQKLGRGVRLHDDKKGLLYFDIASIPAMEQDIYHSDGKCRCKQCI